MKEVHAKIEALMLAKSLKFELYLRLAEDDAIELLEANEIDKNIPILKVDQVRSLQKASTLSDSITEDDREALLGQPAKRNLRNRMSFRQSQRYINYQQKARQRQSYE